MNVLVVYDSKFGNTKRVARAIADALTNKASVRVQSASEQALDLEGLDLLVIGGPTQVHGLTAPMGELVAGMTSTEVPVATFDTRFKIPQFLAGSAASSVAKTLEQNGVTLVAPPESFFVHGTEGPLVEGELERAAAWGKELLAAIGGSAKEVAAAGS
jgi:flavodoxin I